MDLPQTSRLYSAAIAAAKFVDQRLEARTRTDYNGSLRCFSEFCHAEGYPDPLKERFIQLPGVIAAYVNQLATSNKSQWPAEKLRAALSWHYTKPEMLAGGHPDDRWVVESTPSGAMVPRGNPARSAVITQILAELSKAKKRERTPKRASPMSLAMLFKVISFLETDSMFNQTMRVWFSAVCSLTFNGMCRINEVLHMKRSRKSGSEIKFGCFTIRDRKTDHDPLASRTYSLHRLPKEERAAEALTYVERWMELAHTELHHNWMDTDYVFPSLTKIPRGGAKRQKRVEKTGTSQRKDGTADSGTFVNVGIKWGAPMSDSNFTQVLNIVAEAAGISRNLLGDEIWFTSHCFRRGGAQYRFMFAPEERRWSLKLVKWWAGWAPSEKAETVTRYLLDDVLDREQNQLGDPLAPDAISCTNAALQGLQDIDYGCSQPDDTDSNDLSAPFGDASRDVLAPLSHSIVDDIKQTIVEGLREVFQLNLEIARSPRKPKSKTLVTSSPSFPMLNHGETTLISTGSLIQHVINTVQE
ncbi:LOW QUALITY PROTEIN: hypothetical protein PHMEG_00013824 [Phytophthora megakarya]|uniref:Uncharacterized protein n=1 Tax=Phytophthora megakarya TaxID=4795 RepID=A0A225W6U5_9STRA|nr:LOW QUALITY PROTEIN: hypothetical protein PHMEG_00013824 [Phytophthora megakarya]